MFSNIINYGFEFYKRYYSTYRGIVTGFDDPLDLGRVRILVPSIHGRSSQGFLAWHKGEWKGKDSGIQIPIVKGDMVFVEFEHGNASYPIYSYGHRHKGQEKPKEFTEETFGFKTPNGIIVTCDDKEDIITIKNKDGMNLTIEKKKLVLGKDDKFHLTIEDDKIYLGKNNKFHLAIENNELYIGDGKGVKINAAGVTLGGGSPFAEPLVLGTKLQVFLTGLLNFLGTFTVISTPPTLPTLPNSANAAPLAALQAQLQTLISLNTKTD